MSRLTMNLPLSKEEQKTGDATTGDATLPQTEGQKAEWGSSLLFCFCFLLYQCFSCFSILQFIYLPYIYHIQLVYFTYVQNSEFI